MILRSVLAEYLKGTLGLEQLFGGDNEVSVSSA